MVLDVDEDDHAHVRMVGELGEAEAEARGAEFREFLDPVSAEDSGADDAAPPTDEPPADDADDDGDDTR